MVSIAIKVMNRGDAESNMLKQNQQPSKYNILFVENYMKII